MLSFSSPRAQPIYDSEAPVIIPVWHRAADFSPKLRAVEAAEFSKDGRLAASASKFGYKVMLWRVADGALLWEREHESEVECVTFSPDGKRIATGGEDFFVRIWAVDSGKELHNWEHPSGLDGITWSHDGKIIASGSEGGEVFLWDADSYELMAEIEVGSTVNSLEFTKDDRRLVVAGNIQTPDPETGKTIYDGFASLIDMQTKKVIQKYEGHGASVKSVRLSPNEKYVATGSFDHTARLYDMESGKLLKTFEQPLRVEAVAFTPDNQFLAVGGHEPMVAFYRLADLELAHQLPCPRVEYIDFSTDGRLMLTSHEDSGLLSLYMFISDTQGKHGLYQRLSNQQLNNRDLKKN